MDSKKIPMIVAITGGNGFLGSNLAKKFCGLTCSKEMLRQIKIQD
jgi:hypothetical protein